MSTKNLSKILEFGQLKITGNHPTRITEDSVSCLDLIAINRNLHCINYQTGDLVISDHLPVEVEIELSYHSTELRPSYRRNFKKINYADMNKELTKITLLDALDDDPNSLLGHWTNEVEKVLDIYAPLKRFPFVKRKMWTLPPEIIEMINSRKKLANKVKHFPNNSDFIYELKMLQRKVKSHITKFIRLLGERTLRSTNSREA